MRQQTILTALIAFCALLGGISAQGVQYYVDPVNGSDTNTGTDPLNAFKTLTHALSSAAVFPLDQIELQAGTYSAGAPGIGETYPLSLNDRVNITVAAAAQAILDPGSLTTDVFDQGVSFTGSTVLSGVLMTNCRTGFTATAAVNVNGLTIENCAFQNFANAAIDLNLRIGAPVLAIRDCQVTGQPAGSPLGIRVEAAGMTIVGGFIQDCTITNCDVGIAVNALNGGAVQSSFGILRNLIQDHTLAGIVLNALAGNTGGAALNLLVRGNTAIGDPTTTDTGLVLHCETDTGGSPNPAAINSPIEFNNFSANTINAQLTCNGNGSGSSDLTSNFMGNVLANAKDNAVVLIQNIPQANNAPNFGTLNLLQFSGRNTFGGAANNELVLDSNIQSQINAQHNFWGTQDGLAIRNMIDTQGALDPTIDDPLANLMNARLRRSTITPNSVVTVQVNARAGAAFVDNPDPNATLLIHGKMSVTVGAVPVQVFPFLDGSGFTFNSPRLSAGSFVISILNPGGQSATVRLTVQAASNEGGGSSGGCFVATAAHGDYDSEEVRVLRRMRDEYFLMEPAGEAFTRSYYEHGPAAAEYIAERPAARQVARWALAPVVAVSDALLSWNRSERFLAGVLLLGAAFALRRKRR